MSEELESFAPKILIVGCKNTARSILLEVYLREKQSRFSVGSAGIKPGDKVNDTVIKALRDDEVKAENLRPQPISASLDDHLQMTVFVDKKVKENGPIIATPGDKLTLDIDRISKDNSKDLLQSYCQLRDQIKRTWVGRVLEELPGEFND